MQLVLNQQVPIAEAARRLSMSGKTLKNWVGQARCGQLATVGASHRPVTDLEAELSQLKRELTEARMERDILNRVRCEGAAARYACMTTLRQQHSLALLMAVGAKRSRPGLMHHSDRGSHYRAQDYQQRL